jgi:hypothetical protein
MEPPNNEKLDGSAAPVQEHYRAVGLVQTSVPITTGRPGLSGAPPFDPLTEAALSTCLLNAY